jgi:hypothetical protein
MGMRDVRDTTLWKTLDRGFDGREDEALAKQLAQFLIPVCGEAADRMKGFPALHRQYTLHDEAHLLRVTELMAKVMPGVVLRRLNPVEVALLILAAHLHDQGMVLEREEIERLRSGADPSFELFKKNWELEHPNLGEVRRRLGDRNLSSATSRKQPAFN